MGTVGYPEVAEEPFEVWVPPGDPSPLLDAESHPLTWGGVRAAHDYLLRHAQCDSNGGPSSFDSDDDDAPCPCQWHPVEIERVASARAACHAWPGPWCGTCWAASCACGYVFAAVEEAAGRAVHGRLRCHACMP